MSRRNINLTVTYAILINLQSVNFVKFKNIDVFAAVVVVFAFLRFRWSTQIKID